MAVGKTFISDMDPTADGLALTYIVPASACNLKCPFCFIRQRRETSNAVLRPEDYVTFLEGVAAEYPVRVSALQGYEPLLEESWPYSRAILQRSADLGIATSMVTNGIELETRAEELSQLGLKDLTVSLDSASAAVHDGLRGVSGAFEKTVAGIKAAVASPVYGSRVVVASVLLPNRRSNLDSLPDFLSQLGVRYFGVTPLIRAGSPGRRGAMVQAHDSLMRDFDVLRDLCERAGVRFVVDDEFQQFRQLPDGFNRLMFHSLERPDRLVRLTPSGACSVGLEILDRLGPASWVWRPNAEGAAAFLRRIGATRSLEDAVPRRRAWAEA